MMKITIEHNNKIYNFEHGYEAYIFCAAVNNEFDKTVKMKTIINV